MTTHNLLSQELKKLRKDQNEIEENAKKFKEGINRNYSFLDQQLGKLKSQKKEAAELRLLLKDYKDTDQQLKELDEINLSIKRLREDLSPRTGSVFVRLLLGKVNVKQYRAGERFHLKQEYQKFKRKTDPLFLGFVILLLFFRIRAFEIFFQTWLLYYYTTLALRENILQVNGSNIKNWWIIHHYLSIGVSISILSWSPEAESYEHFFPQFLYFSLFQGIVQILQTRYQTAKLYKLIALGKVGTMDVPGEAGSSMWIDLAPSVTFLLPFLLFVQGFQIYNSYTLLRLAFERVVEWQVFACGVLFLALGLGNLGTTLYTYRQKLKE